MQEVFQRIKRLSYIDYGMFTPIQMAAIAALDGPQGGMGGISDMHQQRHMRFGLIENEHRTRQTIRGIREMFRKDGLG